MTAQTSEDKFRVFLLDIADHLNNENLENLKFLCKSIIPEGVLSNIEKPRQLFEELIKRGKLKKGDTSYLEECLNHIHRTDLKEKLQNFVNDNSICANGFSGGSRAQEYGLHDKLTTFIGRDDTVKKITDIFVEKRMIAIIAPPGFGKSSVAIHVGHSMKEQGFLVIFVSLRQIHSCFCMCSAILKTIDPEISLSDDYIQQAKNQLLSFKQPTLLILDNAEDIQNSDASDEFQSFLEFVGSKAKNLKILLGTRKTIHTRFFECKSINLPRLDDESSSKLLLAFAKADGVTFKGDEAEQLGIQCAGVPLLIKIAAGLVTNGYNSTKLANDLKVMPYDVLKLEGHELLEYLTSSVQVFLKRLSRDQQVSLVRLSCFPAEFTADVVIEVFVEHEVKCRGMLSSLRANALLQFDGQNYSLHPLIQTFCREEQQRMNCDKEGKNAMETFSYYYFDKLEELHRQFVSKDCQTALQQFYFSKINLQQALENALKCKDSKVKVRCIDAYNASINLLGKIMVPSQCLKVYEQLYDEAEKMKDKKRMSECLVSRGFRYMCEVNHGKFSQDAFDAFKSAISLWRKTLFKTKQSYTEAYAHCCSKLGLCYIAQGKVEKGQELISDAICIRHSLGDKVLIAAGFCDRAIGARLCRKYEQAITIIENQCLPVYKEHLGDHPWVASLLNYISQCHQDLGCLEKAIDFNKQSLHIREKLLGDHQDTARSYFRLGELFLEQENEEKALTAFKKALSIQKAVLGTHEETQASYQAVLDVLDKLDIKEEMQEVTEHYDFLSSELQIRRAFDRQISEDIKARANSMSVLSASNKTRLYAVAVLVVLVAAFTAFVLNELY